MAISKGIQSRDTQEFKRYLGVAPMLIKAVNPTKKEHEDLYQTVLEKDPEYVQEKQDLEGKSYKTARISVIFQPDREQIGFDMPYITMSLFLDSRIRYNKDKTKVQVIDKYGKTAWATIEEAKEHKIPLSKSGAPLNICSDYRPALTGEEDLMNFIRTYLCIPEPMVWHLESRSFIPNPRVNPEDCECSFDNIQNIFKGDFSEIKAALALQPENKIKVMLGVRTDTNSGALYQAVYTRKFLRANSNNYAALDKEIQNMINQATISGRAVDTEYFAGPVKEYEVTPTVITPTAQEVPATSGPAPADDPFGLPW